MDLKLNLIKKEEDILKNKISFKKNILKETQKKNLDFGLPIKISSSSSLNQSPNIDIIYSF